MRKIRIMLAVMEFAKCAVVAGWLISSIQTVTLVVEAACSMVPADTEVTCIPEEYQEYCEEIGSMYHICPELLIAMAEAESSGDAGTVNSAGDTGLLQVNPKWHRERMQRLGVTDLTDAYGNILVAADYLAELFDEDEDLYLVLMKYNMSHEKAEEYYRQGIYTAYAVNIAERTAELERIREGSFGKEGVKHGDGT